MSTIDSPNYVNICLTVTCDETVKSMLCPTKLVTAEDTTINMKVLIDCSADSDFIDKKYSTFIGIKKQALDKPIKVWNADGTLNEAGTVTHYVMVPLEIGERKQNEQLLVMNLRKQKVILGLPWLERENLDIDWQWKMINWQDEVQP